MDVRKKWNDIIIDSDIPLDEKVTAILHDIQETAPNNKEHQHELGRQSLELCINVGLNVGGLIQELVKALLKQGCLDQDRWELDPAKATVDSYAVWRKNTIRQSCESAWGDGWWVEFNEPKELAVNKSIALRGLVNLSIEEAKALMDEVVEHRRVTGERTRAAKGQYQLKDYLLAQDWNLQRQSQASQRKGEANSGPSGLQRQANASPSGSQQHAGTSDSQQPANTGPSDSQQQANAGVSGSQQRRPTRSSVLGSSEGNASAGQSNPGSQGNTPPVRPVNAGSADTDRQNTIAKTTISGKGKGEGSNKSASNGKGKKNTQSKPTPNRLHKSNLGTGSDVRPVLAELWPMTPTITTSQHIGPSEPGYKVTAEGLEADWKVKMAEVSHRHCLDASDHTRVEMEKVLRQSTAELVNTGMMLDHCLAGDAVTHIVLNITRAELVRARTEWLASTPTGYKYSDGDWADIVDMWDQATDNMEEIQGSVIVTTSDNVNIMWKIEGALDPTLVEEVHDATRCMIHGWLDGKQALPTPNAKDKRHEDIEEAIRRYGANDVGVFHLGYWIPDQGNPRGPIMSSETVAGSYRYRTMCTYESRLQGFYKLVNNTMRLLAPEVHAKYQQYSEVLREIGPDYKTFTSSSSRLHLAMAVVRNLRVLPHTDSGDLHDGLVVMTNLGQAEAGADLVVGTAGLQIKVEYNPGDLVLFNSFLLSHGVTPFQDHAERTALVLFSHKDTVDPRPVLKDGPAEEPLFRRFEGKEVGLDFEAWLQ